MRSIFFEVGSPMFVILHQGTSGWTFSVVVVVMMVIVSGIGIQFWLWFVVAHAWFFTFVSEDIFKRLFATHFLFLLIVENRVVIGRWSGRWRLMIFAMRSWHFARFVPIETLSMLMIILFLSQHFSSSMNRWSWFFIFNNRRGLWHTIRVDLFDTFINKLLVLFEVQFLVIWYWRHYSFLAGCLFTRIMELSEEWMTEGLGDRDSFGRVEM